jgi:hypothetical protein
MHAEITKNVYEGAYREIGMCTKGQTVETGISTREQAGKQVSVGVLNPDFQQKNPASCFCYIGHADSTHPCDDSCTKAKYDT